MNNTKLVRRDEKGIYSIRGNEKDAQEKLEIPWPLRIGLTWITLVGPATFTNTVVGIESVTIGEKKYDNCYHIHTEAWDGGYLEDYWLAPTVGTVKSEIIYGKGNKLTLPLREFKAGN